MSQQWTNWAGNQHSHPVEVATPSRPEEVVAAVARAGARGIPVKAVGASHSFTAIAATDGLQLDLRRLSGVTHVDLERRRVRVLAGTALHELNRALQALGLALPNLGDIDRQSIAGAIATGTHGTGLRWQGIASAVSGLTLTLADGSLLECSAEHEPEVFQAARVGLGALGVVVEVELECVPAFRLHAREFGADLLEVLARVDHDVESNDHVDMHWFPLTDRVLVKHNNRVGQDDVGRPLPGWRARLDDDLLSNRLYGLTNRARPAGRESCPRSTPSARGCWGRGSTPTTRGASSSPSGTCAFASASMPCRGRPWLTWCSPFATGWAGTGHR
jgi:FAD/FMN-containing dehydrogenase